MNAEANLDDMLVIVNCEIDQQVASNKKNKILQIPIDENVN